MSSPTPPPISVLEALKLTDATLTRYESGLINDTWRVDMPDGQRLVLQRLNPIFPVSINDDIELVTQHLEDKGVFTPRLVPTPEDKLTLTQSGERWRLMTFMPGVTRDVLENPRQADEAGSMLARFHLALSDLKHMFVNARLGVHDTPMHLETLKAALAKYNHHARFDEIKPLANAILEIAATLPELPVSADRTVHGDPKISNMVFNEITDGAICLVDLDTIAPMPIILELGDAFRSWCNPKGEDNKDASFSVPFFRAAVTGYAREAWDFLTEEEWQALPAATLTITVELAARFAADALVESHFGWDSKRYGTASEHNQIRAESQVSLAQSIRTQWSAMEDIVAARIGC